MGVQRIILVHGTGASDRGPVGEEKWWETKSEFCRLLVENLNTSHVDNNNSIERFEAESFVWSGANSEADRRKYAKKLTSRLDELEEQQVPYHIIGHSHGGSLIWHALKNMSGQNKPKRLMSWATVGTPFLEFGYRGYHYLFLFVLSLLSSLTLAYYFLGQSIGVYFVEFERIFRDAHVLAVFGSLAGVLGIGAMLLFLIAIICRQIYNYIFFKHSEVDEQDTVFFASRWLPITHKLDEPIAGLRASRIHPPPKLRNKLLDQLVWESIRGPLQGNDVAGEALVDAGFAPKELQFFWKETPIDIQNCLIQKANLAASNTADAVRKHLSSMSLGSARLNEAAHVISFREIIHTSYFEADTGVGDLICEHITSRLNDQAIAEVEPCSYRNSGETSTEKAFVDSWRPFVLHASYALAATIFCLGLSVSTASVEREFLRPYTNVHAIKEIYGAVSTSEPETIALMSDIDLILMRYVLLDRTTEAINIAEKAPQADPRLSLANPISLKANISFAIGYKGSLKEMNMLLSSLGSNETSAVMLVHAIAGSYASSNGFHVILGRDLDSHLDVLKEDTLLTDNLVNVLFSAGAVKQAMDLSESANGSCDPIMRWVTTTKRQITYETLSSKSKKCVQAKMDAFKISDSYVRRNVFETPSKAIEKVLSSSSFTKHSACAVPILRTQSAINACISSGENFESIGSRPLDAKETNSGKITNLSDILDFLTKHGDRFRGRDCYENLEDKIISLQICSTQSENTRKYTRIDNLPSVSSSENSNEFKNAWMNKVWNIDRRGSQQELCKEQYGLGYRIGRQLDRFAQDLHRLEPSSAMRFSDLVLSRAKHEIGLSSSTVAPRLRLSESTQKICSLASLGIILARIDENKLSEKILELVLDIDFTDQKSQVLDLFVGIASGTVNANPTIAKRFLDRSFLFVDSNDPSLFLSTSDGSISDSFEYGKDDIPRLYAQLNEYQLVSKSVELLNRFAPHKTNEIITILDAEVSAKQIYSDSYKSAFNTGRRIEIPYSAYVN